MRKRRAAIHYVNNAEFSQKVVDYVSKINTVRTKYLNDLNTMLKERFGEEAPVLDWDQVYKDKKFDLAKLTGIPQEEIPHIKLPMVTDYIADCFMRIAEGLSHRPNFIRYTYREEMVMDAVENCLKAIENYNIEAATRTGKPNAFSYFTQISWFAFLRRIDKEKRQQDIKMKYMSTAGIDMFTVNATGSDASQSAVTSYVDTLRSRIDTIKDKDTAVKVFAAEEKKREKTRKVQLADSNLEEFIDDGE